ncbi:hypothetical protein CEXT_741161 [Caerostris extrusa]|uniref:Uncharacterized protein n=1 Tax=Caerostris extrusa TaxID=172846 RepID=A0AAV4SSZ2_CAEEX|nr:hypothetical protein CEXT_741161 [Caerostris extrusa]
MQNTPTKLCHPILGFKAIQMPPDPSFLRLCVEPEIEAGLCNKKALVWETSHSITAKRLHGDPSDLTNCSSLEKTGKEVSRNGRGVEGREWRGRTRNE